jgi:hypothetical protein
LQDLLAHQHGSDQEGREGHLEPRPTRSARRPPGACQPEAARS